MIYYESDSWNRFLLDNFYFSLSFFLAEDFSSEVLAAKLPRREILISHFSVRKSNYLVRKQVPKGCCYHNYHCKKKIVFLIYFFFVFKTVHERSFFFWSCLFFSDVKILRSVPA